MVEHGVKNCVFSSSASVYGEPDLGPSALISEEFECVPISPYGKTKLEGERIAKEYAVNHDSKVAALRYFNVAGAGAPELGDVLPFNLVPIVFEALDRGVQPKVFGDDYPTPDGSCIRDYVHVQDLAEAHVVALDFVENSGKTFVPINIGAGRGSSVFEVIEEISHVSGVEICPVHVERREGDSAVLVADVSKAEVILGWRSKRDLSDIVISAWNAWSHRR
jgi:UDP-glucose 4-epimerase